MVSYGEWRILGCDNGAGYLCFTLDGRRYKAHRLAWLYMTGDWPPFDVDHVNMVKSDNRFANLRLATRSQNRANTPRRADNTSGFKGVVRGRRAGTWAAQSMKDGKRVHLGTYDTPEAAHQAYCEAATILFDKFARMH